MAQRKPCSPLLYDFTSPALQGVRPVTQLFCAGGEHLQAAVAAEVAGVRARSRRDGQPPDPPHLGTLGLRHTSGSRHSEEGIDVLHHHHIIVQHHHLVVLSQPARVHFAETVLKPFPSPLGRLHVRNHIHPEARLVKCIKHVRRAVLPCARDHHHEAARGVAG
eukprot:CAMPEP_0177765250 /NCGR_PEP_ID=MMETSP0491_2-20121128/7890_1 /TAXON_ID=63592 /ORGANISM="Tetraselmis chuii, Strain PLY429" /LENGTH=162 /DNA_ID=CAMNT_0019281583 /DNA_START=79 /DNA_END=569 /DNA_ORIENTATION=+